LQTSPIIERLAKLPRGQRFALFAAIYVLVGLAFIFAIYFPAQSEVGDLEKNQSNLVRQKASVEARVANKEVFDEELKRLTKDLKNALKELPQDREIPGLLKGISNLGKKVGLEIRRFTPLPEERHEYVAAVPVEIEVEGSFHEVAMFFDRLANMNRIVYVQDIEMTSPVERGGKVSLRVAGKAVTFRFLSDEEVQKGKKGKGRDKGKGRAGARGGKRKRGKK
jgi:type IV pilus assembly protein PilO